MQICPLFIYLFTFSYAHADGLVFASDPRETNVEAENIFCNYFSYHCANFVSIICMLEVVNRIPSFCL